MNAAAQDTSILRQTMVDCQLRTFDITDADVLASVGAVPREMFLPRHLGPVAYSDSTIEIVDGDTRRSLMIPMVMARMMQSAEIKSTDKVLCIGDGGGYGAAVLASLAAEVVTLDDQESFTRQAKAAFEKLGLENVSAVTGALNEGVESAAPFDVILICGAIEGAPAKLMQQLTDGGRLLAIEKSDGSVDGKAGQVVRYDTSRGISGRLPLFCANAPLLPGFAAKAGFVF